MIDLSRDVTATTIPYGQKTTLPKGSKVEITQELGGSYTILSDYGLLRIEGKDADALGKEAAKGPDPNEAPQDQKAVATAVWNQLKTCYDPEIPVNIVELGLVYENRIEPAGDGGWEVQVRFTLTAPGCGMGPVIANEIRDKCLGVAGVRRANVEVVFDPPWSQAMMSEAAKLQLGMM
jgi:probable FeS assembly SUF system protein SufT